jgi:23S rRNA (cytidine1920-2'-O)/16S rRNA (cytidine1409-2'-O)-methyltransferase
LVERGLAGDLDQALRLVVAGSVLAGTQRIDKPGQSLDVDVPLVLRPADRYVSRGGLKLEHALVALSVDPTGMVALDAGCSTGGFSDCLLSHGARRIYAVDVGYGQLAWKLRQDPRVVVMERTNIRSVKREHLDPAPQLVVADLSFVSLHGLLAPLGALAGQRGRILALVKPQFEVGRGDLVGGVVEDQGVRARAIAEVEAAAARAGLTVLGRQDSPIAGADGNLECFLLLVRAG